MKQYAKKEWSKDLSVGNPIFDKEHRAILEVFNLLVDYMNNSMDIKELARILSLMTDHSLLHFKKEEQYLQIINYPRLTEYYNYHRDYVHKVAQFNISLMNKENLDPKEILHFFEKWLDDTISMNKEIITLLTTEY